ncbi:alpha/beta hydrolase [Geothrix limicola]|uniref:Alpha/beta hydrolase n=1 Tax=Geothrix limicola TaxID=2927978 RepID=A0ABQ5QFM2_9BACT|nr:alpha/beta hydrolase [Geothrix limicola]GLH73384.1 alpha/beta hydrolase [Geothrix limicola]
MFMNVNGNLMAYTDEGSGFPLLFLHGFPLNRGSWSPQVDAFKSKLRVIAPDLRGFGESHATGGLVSMACFAEDVWDLVQQLGIGPLILAGHAMGGFVALTFARMHPKWVRGLMLVGTKAGLDSSEMMNDHRQTAETIQRSGTTLVMEELAPRMLSPVNANGPLATSVRALMASASPEGMRGALLGMAERPDARPWLGKIRVPALVIAGSDDRVIPPTESAALADSIPDSQLRVIPNAGHLVELEQPETFNKVLSDWLAWGCEGPVHKEGRLTQPIHLLSEVSKPFRQGCESALV